MCPKITGFSIVGGRILNRNEIYTRKIKTRVNGYKTVGKYSVSFDASKLASGIYFYQLRVNAGGANNFVSTKKMQLLK